MATRSVTCGCSGSEDSSSPGTESIGALGTPCAAWPISATRPAGSAGCSRSPDSPQDVEGIARETRGFARPTNELSEGRHERGSRTGPFPRAQLKSVVAHNASPVHCVSRSPGRPAPTKGPPAVCTSRRPRDRSRWVLSEAAHGNESADSLRSLAVISQAPGACGLAPLFNN